MFNIFNNDDDEDELPTKEQLTNDDGTTDGFVNETLYLDALDNIERLEEEVAERDEEISELEELNRALDESRAELWGRKAGQLLLMTGKGWFAGVYAFVAGMLSKWPRKVDLADKYIRKAYDFKRRVSGADVLVNVIYGDGMVVPRAGYWQSKEMEYHTENGEKFSARGVGFDPKRIAGKVPVVWALRESAEITEPLEAYMGGQRRLGNAQPHVRTDGGDDIAVHAETAGYQGRALSFADGWRLFGSKVTQEDMDLQEKRGKLAELDSDGMSSEVKLVLAFVGGALLAWFGPALALKILGGADAGSMLSGLPMGGTLMPMLSLFGVA